MTGKQISDIAHLLVYKKKDRGSVTHIADRLGNPGPVVGEWLILTPKENMPKPDIVSFPKPPKAPDGSLMYERIPNKPEAEKIPLNASSPPSLKRRPYEEINGVDSKSMRILPLALFTEHLYTIAFDISLKVYTNK